MNYNGLEEGPVSWRLPNFPNYVGFTQLTLIAILRVIHIARD